MRDWRSLVNADVYAVCTTALHAAAQHHHAATSTVAPYISQCSMHRITLRFVMPQPLPVARTASHCCIDGACGTASAKSDGAVASRCNAVKHAAGVMHTLSSQSTPIFAFDMAAERSSASCNCSVNRFAPAGCCAAVQRAATQRVAPIHRFVTGGVRLVTDVGLPGVPERRCGGPRPMGRVSADLIRKLLLFLVEPAHHRLREHKRMLANNDGTRRAAGAAAAAAESTSGPVYRRGQPRLRGAQSTSLRHAALHQCLCVSLGATDSWTAPHESEGTTAQTGRGACAAQKKQLAIVGHVWLAYRLDSARGKDARPRWKHP